MPVYKVKKKEHGTKVRGKEQYKQWGFTEKYIDVYGNKKSYCSKKYFTKKEADDALKDWLKSNKQESLVNSDMTFRELYVSYRNYKKDKVKPTTFRSYKDREVYLKILDNIIVKDFNIRHFEMWKETMSEKNIVTITKNDIYKYLKAILNFATKYHDIDVMKTYNKMEGFFNPSDIPKEMDFYTDEEFHKIISFETDLKYIALFKTLYYLGLRNGEMRGLTWDSINFDKKEIKINKQVPTDYSRNNFIEEEHLTSLKTLRSVRTLPIHKSLYESLEAYYNIFSQYKNFEKTWFVFGDMLPIVAANPAKRLRELSSKSGIRPIRIHDFRHSCASLLINRGADIKMVADYLGHTKIEETLNTYTHMFPNKLRNIVDLMD